MATRIATRIETRDQRGFVLPGCGFTGRAFGADLLAGKAGMPQTAVKPLAPTYAPVADQRNPWHTPVLPEVALG